MWLSTTYAARASSVSPGLPDLELGKRIYREGILPNGQTAHAVGAGNAAIIGSQITCISCHRRSGLGTSEGKNVAPPITGEILFQPRTQSYRELRGKRLSGEGARPAYTEESFLTAINQGKDVTGRTMNPLMPRYSFSKADAKLLIQYLHSLTRDDVPGISDTTIHFATVFTPDTLPEQKAAAEKTLRAFLHDYNAQTRNEKHRATNSPWHKTWQYESFRQLKLHTWNLKGAAETWDTQLSELYREQPVFALLNGIGNGIWQPVHDFCETREIPCLFPTTDLPGQSTKHYYSIYFTDGVNVEARAIASHLVKESETSKIILQLYRNDEKGQAAATLLSRQLKNNEKIEVINIALDNNTVLNNSLIHEKVRHYKANTVVLWVDKQTVRNISDELGNNSQISTIYVSSTYVRSPEILLPQSALDKTFLLSRFVPNNDLNAHLRRFTAWAKLRDIDLKYTRETANAYFTALIITSAIRSMRANLSRDYLIERIEHILERPVFHSVFPAFTLGPGQRFASKGNYIIGPFRLSEKNSTPPREWVVP